MDETEQAAELSVTAPPFLYVMDGIGFSCRREKQAWVSMQLAKSRSVAT